MLHLLPAAGLFTYLWFDFFSLGAAIKSDMMKRYSVYTETEISVIWVGGRSILVLTYMIASLIRLREYRERLKECYSDIEKISLSWLSFLIGAILIIWACALSGVFMGKSMSFDSDVLSSLNALYIVFLFLFANLMVLKSLRNPAVFSTNGAAFVPEKKRSNGKADRQYLDQLKRHLEENVPYLTPGLSREDLAQQLSMSPRTLSRIIHENYHQNFFDFINSNRIEAAKSKLVEAAGTGKTVLEILYEVGFNSKSVFNAAFKKHVGMTPTAFKKNLIR